MVSFLKSLTTYNLNIAEDAEEIKPILTNEEYIRDFRTALQAVPGLSVSADDAFLLRFLRAKSFNISDAIKLYKGTDGWKQKNAHILNIPFSQCASVYKTKLFTALKQKDQEGRTIFHVQVDKWEPSKHSLHELIRVAVDLIEESQKIDANCINGIFIILDMTGLSLIRAIEMVSHFSVQNVKTLLGFAQGGSPVKLKGFHGISSPFVAYTTYLGIKYLIKRKMRDRISFHYDGYTVIHKYCDKERLPQFLGGNIPNELAEDKELVQSIFRRNNMIFNNLE